MKNNIKMDLLINANIYLSKIITHLGRSCSESTTITLATDHYLSLLCKFVVVLAFVRRCAKSNSCEKQEADFFEASS
jgi:hypothetical protein